MIKKIKRRFIIYNMLVISISILILAFAVLIGSDQPISLRRWLVTGVIAIIVVYISSQIISAVAIAPIKEAWQRQLNFTADASHELRTPLAVIQTNLELVIDNPRDTVAEQSQWLENSLFETQRMSNIVNDLLLLSRADTEANRINAETINLSLTLEAALKPLESLSASKDIILVSNIQKDIYLHGDAKLLTQLVVILTDNAIKYMNFPGSVDITLVSQGKEIILKVSDTGEGIAAEDLNHIFDRFYRVDKSRSRDEGGTGLGLPIAQWIVSSHKGSIKVNSTVGAGTEFIVTLPKT